MRPVSTKHPNWRIGVPNKVLPRQGVTTTEDKAEPSTADTEELEFANVRIPITITSDVEYEPEIIFEPDTFDSPMPTSQEKGGDTTPLEPVPKVPKTPGKRQE